MKQIILYTVLLAIGFNIYAQNSIENVLIEVEKNNTTLSALRKDIEAEKIGNKTGLLPQNPEAEFNYLWGNPSDIGNRTDFSISQSFDFPTAYLYKNQISNLKNQQAEMEYQKQRKSILLKTRMVCSDLIYSNALKSELQKRLANAKQIASAYKSKFSIGEANILEFNKAQVNLLTISKEVEVNDIERNLLISELTSLNGGISISFTDSIILTQAITPDFEQWYKQSEQSNPELQWIKQEIAIREKQKQLNTSMSLPKFNTGYMSENVVGQQYQGITAGISIPLWESKNTIKYAKAKTIAMQSIETDTKLHFYNEMKALHSKVISLQNSVVDYRNNLVAFSNTELLQKALDKGEISLAEYILELSVYYESIGNLLEMERNLNKAIAELYRFE